MHPPSDERATLLLLGLGPLALACNGAIDALALGGAALAAAVAAVFLFSLVQRRVADDIRLAIFVLMVATLVAALGSILHAGCPALYAGVQRSLPLVALAAVVLGGGGRADAPAAALRNAARDGIGALAALTLLAALREAAGQGTVFADAGARLSLPMLEWEFAGGGFRPLLLPAGAFALLALGLALHQRRRMRRP
jgi:electron transport complex protein RnfE